MEIVGSFWSTEYELSSDLLFWPSLKNKCVKLNSYNTFSIVITASSGDSDKDLSRPGSGLSPGMGRITGSASIETLVRVGIEKEHGLSPDSKMVVLHDFAPCVDDELEVRIFGISYFYLLCLFK